MVENTQIIEKMMSRLPWVLLFTLVTISCKSKLKGEFTESSNPAKVEENSTQTEEPQSNEDQPVDFHLPDTSFRGVKTTL